jgi:hypothetical protein
MYDALPTGLAAVSGKRTRKSLWICRRHSEPRVFINPEIKLLTAISKPAGRLPSFQDFTKRLNVLSIALSAGSQQSKAS